MAADGMQSPERASLTRADLERIASLIDDRLDDEERREALRLLAESREAYRVYVESLAIVRPEDESGARDVAPPAAEPEVSETTESSPAAPAWRTLLPAAQPSSGPWLAPGTSAAR